MKIGIPKEIKLINIFDAVDEKVKTVQCKKESKKGCNGKATKCKIGRASCRERV